MDFICFLKKYRKFGRKFRLILKKCLSYRILLKQFIFIGLSYQLLKLTIDYTEYETIMDLRAEAVVDDYIGLTVCVRLKHRSNKSFKNYNKNFGYINESIIHSIICKVLMENNKYYKCQELCPIYISSTPFSDQCFTFLSCNYIKITKKSIHLDTFDNNLLLLIHQTKTPPHLLTNYINLKLKYFFMIEYQITEEVLLPLPYKTDCYDYEQNSQELNSPKSREECILNYLKQIEYKKCKSNQNWFYELYNGKNFTNNYSRIMSNNCSSKVDKRFLKRICKKSCLTKSFISTINRETETDMNYFLNKSKSSIRGSSYYKIKITHSPKMDFITYLCSIGSLNAMWIGISFYSLAFYFKRIYSKTFGRVYFLRYYLYIWRTRFSSKLRRIRAHNRIFMTICMGLMLIQVIGVIQNYFEYEIITRFEMKSHLNVPKVSLKSMPTKEKIKYIFKNLLKIYPEFEEKLSILSKNRNYPKVFQLLNTYILKYLSEHSFQEYFDLFLDPKSIVKLCYFVINQKRIDCPKPDYYLEIKFEKQVYAIADLFGNLNKTEKSILISLEIEKYLEKIVIELDSYSNIVLEIFRNHFHFHQLSKPALIQSNSINNLFYSSNILRQISSYENQCHDKNDIFESDFIDNSIIKCWIKNLNQTYSCLPIMSSYLWIPIENDFDSVRYKFCSIEKIGNKSLSLEILKKCKLSLESECNVNLFETKSSLIRLKGIHNRTIVNIIPEISIKPEYSESLKTDLNELIYNCGGIIGMWSGFSAVSITHYTVNFLFTKFPKLLKTLFIFLTHYLK